MVPINAYYLSKWLEAFLLTQAVEMPIYAFALWRLFRPGWRVLVLAFAASAITHPIVWFGFPWFRWNYWLLYGVVETFAIVVEAAYLWMLGMRPLQALTWSFVANAASVAVGEFLRRVLGWI